MSTPFWIFVGALCVLCLSALASRHLFSRRIAKHTKAEEALDARTAAFKERVSARNARVLAAEKPKVGPDDKSKSRSTELGRLAVSDNQVESLYEPGGGIMHADPRGFASFTGIAPRRLVILDNGKAVLVEDAPFGETILERFVDFTGARSGPAYDVVRGRDLMVPKAKGSLAKRYR